jgi:predicted nuclease of restriction endonuclease-like (RecB) superfamily
MYKSRGNPRLDEPSGRGTREFTMTQNGYGIQETFIADIRAILSQARAGAYAAINTAMVKAYWQIGRRIVEEEQQGKERADYGTSLIRELARRLSTEFGKGFSVANLWNFRQFYQTFPSEEILYTLCRGLSWSHLRLIMRVENPQARDYYLAEAAGQRWSARQLDRNIHSLYYERLLSTQGKSAAIPTESSPNPPSSLEFIKDPYVLEFLRLPEDPAASESQIESAIITNLQKFLLELGKGFSFVARQFRISTETSHFYVDLVFYNYLLKCFVLIDLKTGKLNHQDIGQMDMYVRMFDDLKRRLDDNPTIGIILCTGKDETAVRYSVLKDSEQLFASKYRLVLPSEEELKEELEREKRLVETTPGRQPRE